MTRSSCAPLRFLFGLISGLLYYSCRVLILFSSLASFLFFYFFIFFYFFHVCSRVRLFSSTVMVSCLSLRKSGFVHSPFLQSDFLVFTVISKIKGTVCIPGQACLFCRYSSVLTCVVCLRDTKKSNCISSCTRRLRAKLVHRWENHKPPKYYKYDPTTGTQVITGLSASLKAVP